MKSELRNKFSTDWQNGEKPNAIAAVTWLRACGGSVICEAQPAVADDELFETVLRNRSNHA